MRTYGIREWIAVAVAVVAAIILFFGGSIWNLFFGAPDMNSTGTELTSLPGQPTNTKTTMTNTSTTTGVEIYDIKVGTGAEATDGKMVSAHYVGTLTNGTKFDSSIDRGTPYTFELGAGEVIRGWDVGIVGMKVGGVRKLVIAPQFGYGVQAMGPIPANSTLIFEVQLVDVK